MASPTF